MRFIHTIKFALRCIAGFFVREKNGQLQLAAAMVAVGLGFGLHISAIEWSIVLICIASVFAFEMINSALEKLCDLVSDSYHPQIKIIKDFAAGAVLLTAVASLIIGIIIFLNKLISLF